MKPEDRAWHIAQAAKIREDEAEIAEAREGPGDTDDDEAPEATVRPRE